MNRIVFPKKTATLCVAVMFLMTPAVGALADSKGKSYHDEEHQYYHGDQHDSDHGNYHGDYHDNYYGDHHESSRHAVEINRNVQVYGVSPMDARQLAVQYGYTGYGALPPGIRKDLVTGKPWPRGIAVRAVPVLVLDQLPRYQGYEWRRCGDDLVLVSIGTAIVASVLLGVFRQLP
jgi:Ni/Co efflux regulator RcnB